MNEILAALRDYYHGWLSGGFFHWAYPINGVPAPQEPWHTPYGFWLIHIGLLLGLVITLIHLVKLAGRLIRKRRIKNTIKGEGKYA